MDESLDLLHVQQLPSLQSHAFLFNAIYIYVCPYYGIFEIKFLPSRIKRLVRVAQILVKDNFIISGYEI